jgi:hypothetical protein
MDNTEHSANPYASPVHHQERPKAPLVSAASLVVLVSHICLPVAWSTFVLALCVGLFDQFGSWDAVLYSLNSRLCLSCTVAGSVATVIACGQATGSKRIALLGVLTAYLPLSLNVLAWLVAV